MGGDEILNKIIEKNKKIEIKKEKEQNKKKKDDEKKENYIGENIDGAKEEK